MTALLSIYACAAADGGCGNVVVASCDDPEFDRRFEVTLGGTLVMGRKTFELWASGDGCRRFVNRRVVVVTTDRDYDANAVVPGADSAPDLTAAVIVAKTRRTDRVWIVGGMQVFAAALPIADEVWLSIAPTPWPEADFKFPGIAELEAMGFKTQESAVNAGYTYVVMRRPDAGGV